MDRRKWNERGDSNVRSEVKLSEGWAIPRNVEKPEGKR